METVQIYSPNKDKIQADILDACPIGAGGNATVSKITLRVHGTVGRSHCVTMARKVFNDGFADEELLSHINRTMRLHECVKSLGVNTFTTMRTDYSSLFISYMGPYCISANNRKLGVMSLKPSCNCKEWFYRLRWLCSQLANAKIETPKDAWFFLYDPQSGKMEDMDFMIGDFDNIFFNKNADTHSLELQNWNNAKQALGQLVTKYMQNSEAEAFLHTLHCMR